MKAEPDAPRRGRVAALAYFAFALASLIWPVFPLLGNHIEPRVAGLPWSLVYVLGIVALNALVLALLYVRRVVRTDDSSLGEDEGGGGS